jgi:hypothetical protein
MVGALGVMLRGALLFAAGASASADAASGPIALGRIRVQLFYQYSGTLSRDIAPPARFELWNVGAGEGSADEPAEDALVTVPLSMPRGSDMAAFAPDALTISVRNAGGAVLGQRRYPRDSILVPYAGQAYARLWINDIQCAGKLTVEVRYGRTVRSAKLDFACGE